MQAERRAIGQRNEAERRGGGRAMEERRRGTKAVDDLNSLVEPPRRTVTLGTIAPVGGFPAQRGRGVWNDARTPRTGGGGIASPLTERTREVEGKRVPDRAYHETGYKSSDGLFILPSIRTMNLRDADGNPVVINLASPEGTVDEPA